MVRGQAAILFGSEAHSAPAHAKGLPSRVLARANHGEAPPTWVGMSLLVVSPRPSWASELLPQLQRLPVFLMARV